MPRFVVPVESLPAPYLDGTHNIRFRITTEDKNITSEWSTLYVLDSLGQIYPQEALYNVEVGSGFIGLTWETPSIYNVGPSAIGASVIHNHESEWKVHDSDIFVKFQDELTPNFVYWGRSRDNHFNIIPYSGATSFRAIVQVANHPPTLSEKFKLFDTGIVSLI